MSRRKISKKRSITRDPLYNSHIISMMTMRIIKHGKKNLAYKIIYKTLDIIRSRCLSDPLHILEKAVRNATPIVEIKAKRVGGSTYQVPLEVRAHRGTNLAIQWIIKFSRSKSGKAMSIKLANEIINTANNTGNSIRKKDETHKMAEANKAFAYYRY
uniref:Ribosomal protein S7 n=1 Tax=Hildenbrandia rivularis TaxID=135206 RepID=A0A1C9CFP7_9FLOR|nr:ribosomal protein S7 [Hildenbrandia rivularis]AOM67218.1 ribosomal protein S7 [Hildenbrandia rivularis]